ncbi:MAG: amino acid permease [Chloroflexi bacterium]|nr:amino acid permease [Chloroflexota bacterium]
MIKSRKQLSVTLSRGLGLFDVTMIGVGAMIGAGIFGLTGIAAGKAGPLGLLLAFALNGIVTTLTGLSYAEMGAAIPEAGGGYIFVRNGMSRFWGFMAGWFSWFGNSVASSLYAIIFGAFFIELMGQFGLGFTNQEVFLNLTGTRLAETVVTVLIIVIFITINVRGASEAGIVGNIITIFKILVLMTLVVFGLFVMFGSDSNWIENFQNPAPGDGSFTGGLFPNGFGGIILAMGLTFVAFEGYEIIAQSGEELINPKRNLPRAIFFSIGITVAVYLLVAFVSIGALSQDSGLPNWMYLGREGEKAMIRTAESIIPLGLGAIILIIGGLASTTSAINATLYSSSRVSFAMGRGGDLPNIFSRIHRRNHTPHIAIYSSGALIILAALFLPIADVASGASLTFLLLFILANISLLQLRKKRPDLPRSFRVPLVPFLPILAILGQSVLVIALLNMSRVASLAAVTWAVIGIWLFLRLGARDEAAQEADTILMEETIAERAFSLLLPVETAPEARQLARLAATLAHTNDGEVFALHVVRVPQQLSLSDGRDFLKHGRPLLEEVVTVGQELAVPVRTQLRLGRDISKSIMAAAQERHADLILLGWPGTRRISGSAFGSVIDMISANPPADLAVVRMVRTGIPKRILVPIINGANSNLAIEIALSQAQYAKTYDANETSIVALYLVPLNTDEKTIERRRSRLIEKLDLDGLPVELRILPSQNEAEDILAYAEDFDEIVIGASEEGLLGQQLFGSVPQQIAEDAQVNVIMVKHHNPIKHGLLGRLLGRRPAKRNNNGK